MSELGLQSLKADDCAFQRMKGTRRGGLSDSSSQDRIRSISPGRRPLVRTLQVSDPCCEDTIACKENEQFKYSPAGGATDRLQQQQGV